jgi:outer membrane protein TolC
MFYRLIYIILLIISLTSFAYAKPLSLNEAMEIALKQNPDILSVKAAWDSAKAKIPQSLSLEDPRIGLEYEQIPSGSRNPEEGMKMYTAEQMIKFPGKIYAEYQTSVNETEMAEALYLEKVSSIKSQVKSAYYDLFFMDRALETAREVKGLLYQAQKAAEARYSVGDVPQTDLLQANIEYLKTDNELANLRKEREVKELKLKSLLNRLDDSSIDPEPALYLPATIEAETTLKNAALEKNPELKNTKAEIKLKESGLLLSKLEYFSDTSLGIRKRIDDGWDAMVSFSVPLYFWKQGSGVAQAGYDREAAQANFNNTKNMIVLEIKEAYVMADSSRRNMELYKKSIIPQSEQALKSSFSAYRTGKASFLSLLEIEKIYYEAKLKYFENQVNHGKALAELEKITGRDLL